MKNGAAPAGKTEAKTEHAAVKEAERQVETAMASEDGRTELKKLFDAMDKNKDGEVTSKEWGQAAFKNKDVVAKYFGGSTPKEICGAFKRLDVAKKGTLTWAEFEAATKPVDTSAVDAQKAALEKAMASTEGKEDLKKLFLSLDVDSSGAITAEE